MVSFRGQGNAVETPIGYVPSENALDMSGLDISPETMKELLSIDKKSWQDETADQKKFLDKIDTRLPQEIMREWNDLNQRITAI